MLLEPVVSVEPELFVFLFLFFFVFLPFVSVLSVRLRVVWSSVVPEDPCEPRVEEPD